MKILSIVFILIFSLPAFGQFAKGDLVVPKFTESTLKFDKIKVWTSMNQYSLAAAKSANGAYILNGKTDWQGVFPLLAEFHIKEIETSKKKPSRVLLLGKTNQIEVTIPNDLNLQEALDTILFKGNIEGLTTSGYFQDLEKRWLPILFTDKLARIPFDSQRKLLREADYSISPYQAKFKEKSYLAVKFSDDVIYNTIQLNQAARAARQTESGIKKLKSIFQITGKLQEIEGIKLAAEIRSKDFVSEKFSRGNTETFEMYVPFDLLQKFIEAEITNQELIDGSIILVEGNRLKIDLTNFK